MALPIEQNLQVRAVGSILLTTGGSEEYQEDTTYTSDYPEGFLNNFEAVEIPGLNDPSLFFDAPQLVAE